jgi:hypothetical protein
MANFVGLCMKEAKDVPKYPWIKYKRMAASLKMNLLVGIWDDSPLPIFFFSLKFTIS